MPSKSFVVIDDKVIEANGTAVPNSIKGLEHIVGKKTPDDRKYVMKVDPSLVKEKIQGKEAENLGRQPVLVYDIGEPGWTKNLDGIAMLALSFIIGAGTSASLYYWGIIHIFAH